jgi:hypothetical protein
MYDLNYDGNSSDCVYNADETGLFYRMKPEYTLEKSGSKASGCKKSKPFYFVEMVIEPIKYYHRR